MNLSVQAPSWHRSHPIAAQLIGVLGVGSVVGLLMYLVRGKHFWVGMLYAQSISLCIAYSIGVLQFGVSRLLLRKDPDNPKLQHHWPGWSWMMGCVLIGSVVGHELGTLLAAGLLGHQPRGLFNGDLRQLVLGGGFTLLVALIATYYFYSREKLHAMELERTEVQRQAAEAQLLALQTQIEPHMLFNTLAHLRVLIKLRPDDAQAMLDDLIAYLRATLQASRVPLHPLATEFERIQDYLRLMQRRMGDRLRVQLDLPDALATTPVPPLILQPLVENAIKHGLEPSKTGGQLRVSARMQSGLLELRVEDDGVGLGAPSKGGTQFGTQQVRERLRTQYGDRASFRLDPAPPPASGCLAILELPL
ncbi:sensor histidine kinase [Inhella sp.]|uniref:sensor histidine kinase n=1 Tax=Inhella sp. TaxID=1921806 RepID=UPI0035B0F9F4